MARYHINGKGDAGLCRAEAGGCPFGGDAEHYTSPEAAREAFEKQAESFDSPLLKARKARNRAVEALDKAEIALNKVAAYEGLSELTQEGAKFKSAQERYQNALSRKIAAAGKVEQLEIEDQEGEKTPDFAGSKKVPHDFTAYNSNYDGSPTYQLGGAMVIEHKDGSFSVNYHKAASLTSGFKAADSFEAAVRFARSVERRNAEWNRKNPVVIRPWD